MNTSRITFPVAVCLLNLAISPCALQAGDANFAVGAKISTLGIQAEATVALTDTLNLRGSYNFLDYSTDEKFDDINYAVDINFSSVSALIDWHPFKNGFRITGGVVQHNSDATLDATPTEAERIGDTVYPAEIIGTVTGDVDFDDLAPYVGIGFGNAIGDSTSFSFSFDLGVAIQSYDITLSAPSAALVPGLEDDLRAEEKDIEDDLNDYEIYPVIAFGIAYRF
ncbi:MAG: hypothetical protein O2923_14620 [Verrucomicrobia bacterium]|nr:hypothetical protein [Verrucomicrobiota bacterium]